MNTKETRQIEVLGNLWPVDDGKRELGEVEFWERFLRVDGNAVCAVCGEPYRKHPDEDRPVALGFDGPFTVRACDGIFGKL